MCVEAVNITSLTTAFPHLMARKAIMVLTEHSTHPGVHEGWKKKARAQGYQLCLGPADPEAAAGRARAGVGFLAPAQYCMTVMEPRAKTCAKAVALGRALRAVFRVGPREVVVVYGLYGCAGGHCEPAKARRADAIVGGHT